MCLNWLLLDGLEGRGGWGQKEEGGYDWWRGQWLLPAFKEKPFVAGTLAGAAWPFAALPPLSSKPTTADDKVPAANYPADGESLKWDCQS